MGCDSGMTIKLPNVYSVPLSPEREEIKYV
jgi:hypothetical protein